MLLQDAKEHLELPHSPTIYDAIADNILAQLRAEGTRLTIMFNQNHEDEEEKHVIH